MPFQVSLKGYYDYMTEHGGPRYEHQFIVRLNVLDSADPSINDSVNTLDSSSLTFMCTSTSIPQVTLTASQGVSFLATEFKFPGIVKYPETWEVTVKLDQNISIYNSLLSWKQELSSIRNNNGGRKTIPNAFAYVDLLDSYLNTSVKTFKLCGIWIKELGQVQFEYSEGQSEPTSLQLTFAIQWVQQCDSNDNTLSYDGIY